MFQNRQNKKIFCTFLQVWPINNPIQRQSQLDFHLKLMKQHNTVNSVIPGRRQVSSFLEERLKYPYISILIAFVPLLVNLNSNSVEEDNQFLNFMIFRNEKSASSNKLSMDTMSEKKEAG